MSKSGTCSLRLTMFVIAVLLCHIGEGWCLAAQPPGRAAGLYQSPRGFGLVYQYRGKEDDIFGTLTVMADTYGVLKNKCNDIGLRVNLSRNYRLLTIRSGDCYLDFFAGSGLSAGYVRDYEDGNLALTSPLVNNPGFLAALSGCCGIHFSLPRSVDVELSWMTEFGMHLRADEYRDAMLLKLYKNGLIRTYMPQILIVYKW